MLSPFGEVMSELDRASSSGYWWGNGDTGIRRMAVLGMWRGGKCW